MSNATDQPRRALGRGLSSLLPSKAAGAAPAQEPAHTPASGPLHIPIDSIEANPLQPRTVFQSDRLAELAQSIRENGIIQPLVVRKEGDRYQLIAGERRLRAAKMAGLLEVPVVVQQFADDRLMEITLIENIQREDLNPIEVAHAFERLSRQFSLSHEQIAARTGKDRTSITNTLRLLRLPEPIQLMVSEQRLSMGQARALLGLPDPKQQIEAAERVVKEGMSVRQTEKLVQKLLEPPMPTKTVRVDPNTKAAIDELERTLGTRVRIVARGQKSGRIEIEYYSIEELTRIYEQIVGS